MKQIQLDFPHGLEDCVYLACALPLYVKRGHDITVRCNPDKRIVFEDSGVHIVHEEIGIQIIPGTSRHRSGR
jgi:hypothetical protein